MNVGDILVHKSRTIEKVITHIHKANECECSNSLIKATDHIWLHPLVHKCNHENFSQSNPDHCTAYTWSTKTAIQTDYNISDRNIYIKPEHKSRLDLIIP
jgi:hypothetical protein